VRYAILSDIHANLQAWQAVERELTRRGVDRVISLGDLVGYGPNPVEVFTSAYPRIDHHLLGNHDAAVCYELDMSHWNPGAKAIIDWTREQLSSEMIAAFRAMSLCLTDGRLRCTHGEFSHPGCFFYVSKPEHALRSWSAVDEQLLFVGHSHAPALYVLGGSGVPHKIPPQPFVLEEGKRYLVNVGSVGCPRDGGVEASFCVYDSHDGSVEWVRVPFDLLGFRESLCRAGMSEEAVEFLAMDPESYARTHGVLRVRPHEVVSL
jgi:predicted phosphodiesterase